MNQILRICLSLVMTTPLVTHAAPNWIVPRVAPATGVWSEAWSALESEWILEFSRLIEMVREDRSTAALNHLDRLLSVIGRVNILAQIPARKADRAAVDRAVKRIIVHGAVRARVHSELLTPAQEMSLRVLLETLKTRSQSWVQVRRATAPDLPSLPQWLKGRLAWAGSGFLGTFIGIAVLKPEHTHPYTYLTAAVATVSAITGCGIAVITAPDRPRSSLPWHRNCVTRPVATAAEQCSAAMTVEDVPLLDDAG